MNQLARNIAFASLVVMAVVGTRLPTAGAQQVANAADVSSHPWIGEDAPEFSLKTVGGEKLALKDLKGKTVVIHFGASW